MSSYSLLMSESAIFESASSASVAAMVSVPDPINGPYDMVNVTVILTVIKVSLFCPVAVSRVASNSAGVPSLAEAVSIAINVTTCT